MKPFLAKYKSRLINVDFIDVVGGRYWGYEVYPEVSSQRGWYLLDKCQKICDDGHEGRGGPSKEK